MEKIHALAVAPYEGLRSMIENIAETRTDVQITTYLGNLELGADLVRELDLSKYDIIISRGGTAHLIAEVTTLPVIDITLSHYDILNCIKLAENYPSPFAIIGFPSITHSATILCNILQLDTKIVTLNSTSETPQKLLELKKLGYSLVISDTTAIDIAKEMDMNAILITSSVANIETAIEQAVNLSRHYTHIFTQNLFYNAALKNELKNLIVYSLDDTMLFNDADSSCVDFLGITRKLLPSVKKYGKRETVQKIRKEYYRINGFQSEVRNAPVIMFVIQKVEFYSHPTIKGVTTMIKSDIVTGYFSLLYNSQSYRPVKTMIEQYSKTSNPILITGEIGTGKDAAAQIIFRNSTLSHQTLYIVDFSLISAKDWQYLLDNPFSYFMDNNNTFYFKNILLLPEEKLEHFLFFIENTNLAKRNRLIFSLQHNDNEVKKIPLYPVLRERLNCLTIHLAPLRKLHDAIPSLVSLFLNEYNMLHANQLSGCESDGMLLLQKFSWEYNLNQFLRVLHALASTTSSPLIPAENIRRILEDEHESIPVNNSHLPGIHLDKTLDEIIFEIANEVLKNEKMNQTKAAKKLGISRTTLWRILNKK